MIKQITILLFFAVLFTGCYEKGYILKPIKKQTISSTKKDTKKIKIKKQTSSSTKKIVKEKSTPTLEKELPKQDLSIKSNQIVSTPKVIIEPDTEKTENSFFSSFSDETKNNISGFFVILIGIMILL